MGQRIFDTTYTANNLEPSHLYKISVTTVSHSQQSSATTIQIQTSK